MLADESTILLIQAETVEEQSVIPPSSGWVKHWNRAEAVALLAAVGAREAVFAWVRMVLEVTWPVVF